MRREIKTNDPQKFTLQESGMVSSPGTVLPILAASSDLMICATQGASVVGAETLHLVAAPVSLPSLLKVTNIIGKRARIVKGKSQSFMTIANLILPVGKFGVYVKKITALRNSAYYATMMILSVSMAYGQGTPKLDLQISDQKINLSATEQQAGASINYGPGDTLRYILVASNIGDGLMTNPEIVDPVPAGVTYVAESARGEDTEISFSIDQGKVYMEWPPYYMIRNSRGILVKREATPDMITSIKWKILKNLEPGEAMTLDFLVVVD